jgi:hypothetical protein
VNSLTELAAIYDNITSIPCTKSQNFNYIEDSLFRILRHLEPYKIFFQLLTIVTKNFEIETKEVSETFDWIISEIVDSGKLKQEVIGLLSVALNDSQIQQFPLGVFETFPKVSAKILSFFYEVCNCEYHVNSSTDCNSELFTNFTINFLETMKTFRFEIIKFNLLFHHAREIATKCKTEMFHLGDGIFKQLYFNEETTRNWYHSLRHCAKYNSTLISIESENEMSLLSNFIGKNFESNKSFHLGAIHDNEKNFFWLSNGEQINTVSTPHSSCLGLEFDSNTRNSTFNIIDCLQLQGFICQKLIRS